LKTNNDGKTKDKQRWETLEKWAKHHRQRVWRRERQQSSEEQIAKKAF